MAEPNLEDFNGLSFLEELGFCSGDIILYLPTNQLGVIKRIWNLQNHSRYEVKLLTPDKKLWVESKNELRLLNPVS